MAHDPGYNFSDGKLRIFTEDSVSVIVGWPEPSAVLRVDGAHRWHPFYPDMRLVNPYRGRRTGAAAKGKDDAGTGPEQGVLPLEVPVTPYPRQRRPLSLAEQKKRALESFRFSLPREVARALEPYRTHQWSMLVLYSYSAEALELFRSSPALVFLLAHNEMLHLTDVSTTATRQARRAVGVMDRRQRDILQWLGFPGTEAAARILRKIPAQSMNLPMARGLRDLLISEETVKRLSHLPRVNLGVIEMVRHPDLSRHCTQGLLDEIAANRQEDYAASIAETLAETLDLAFALTPDRPVSRQFASVGAIQELHDRLGVEYCRTREHQIRALKFPKPPVPGTAEIVPIDSAEQLIAEGDAQQNCVATYARRVAEGHCYIYRILHPQRATLSITKTDGRWQRSELKARRNTEATDATRDMVDNWLENGRVLFSTRRS